MSCLRFGLLKVQDEEGCTALRKSRVFATVLGGQGMVIEDVVIETETSRGKAPVTSEVLVFEVRPKASRIPEFVAVARTIRRHRQFIIYTLDHGLSNARSEATDTHLRAPDQTRLRIPQP